MANNNGLETNYRELQNECQALKRRLESKVEAVVLVSQELASVQRERDDLKGQNGCMSETLQSCRTSMEAMRKERGEIIEHYEAQYQETLKIMNSLNSENRILQAELDKTKTQLTELTGDVKILRQQLARYQLKQESTEDLLDETFSDLTVGADRMEISTSKPAAKPTSMSSNMDELLGEIERLNGESGQLERDLRSVLCEKEELVIERDTYKGKVERLNKEITYILSGDENRVIDVDAVINENKFLKEQLRIAQEETGIAKTTVAKYKEMLDKRRKTPSEVVSTGVKTTTTLITQKQVQAILQQVGPSTGRNFHDADGTVDFRALAGALFDAVNDKNLALSHQRKVNKVLGARLNEVETRLKSLEASSPFRHFTPRPRLDSKLDLKISSDPASEVEDLLAESDSKGKDSQDQSELISDPSTSHIQINPIRIPVSCNPTDLLNEENPPNDPVLCVTPDGEN